MTPQTTAHLLSFLPIVFVGLILPWLGHSLRGILFGVTVPLDFVESPQAQSILRRYRLSVFALVLSVIATVAAVLWLLPSNTLTSHLATTLAVPIELIVTFILWRRGAAAVRPHAAIIPLERQANLLPASTTAPLLATVLSLLPLAATALWLRLHWEQIPARWPNHWNASGIANGWSTRTPGGVFGPPLIGALVILLLIGVAFLLARASGPQTAQRQRALVPMAALSWLVAGMLSLVGALPLTHLAAGHLMLLSALYLTVVFAIAFWMLWRSGLAPRSNTTEPYDSTPDARWYGGIVYYNPADAAILVPKRFGWGWTLNFARPAAWMCLGATIVFALAIALLRVLLK